MEPEVESKVMATCALLPCEWCFTFLLTYEFHLMKNWCITAVRLLPQPRFLAQPWAGDFSGLCLGLCFMPLASVAPEVVASRFPFDQTDF